MILIRGAILVIRRLGLVNSPGEGDELVVRDHELVYAVAQLSREIQEACHVDAEKCVCSLKWAVAAKSCCEGRGAGLVRGRAMSEPRNRSSAETSRTPAASHEKCSNSNRL